MNARNDERANLPTAGVESGAVIADTPDKIRLFQLISAKAAIKLEKLGLRHSRFRCGVRGLWAKHYNLGPRASADKVLTRIQEDIDTLATKIQNEQQELPL